MAATKSATVNRTVTLRVQVIEELHLGLGDLGDRAAASLCSSTA